MAEEIPKWCRLVDSMVERICKRKGWDVEEVKALLADNEEGNQRVKKIPATPLHP